MSSLVGITNSNAVYLLSEYSIVLCLNTVYFYVCFVLELSKIFWKCKDSFFEIRNHAYKITIYAPMICTAPCVIFLMRVDTLRGHWASGRRLGPGNGEFFGPCEMASS